MRQKNYVANSSIDCFSHEVGESVEADFEKAIWTFRMEGNYRVSAGRFAIMPAELHEVLTNRLDLAERILRSFIETQSKETMGERGYEAVLSFFDPPPLG